MSHYLIRRVAYSLLTVLGVMTITFLIVHLLPGDAVSILLADAPQQYVAEMRHALGLDQPIHLQYVQWLVPLVTRFDLGNSITLKKPVAEMLLQRVPITLELTVLGTLFALIVSLPLGIAAARNRGSWIDYLVMQFSQLGASVPGFWIGSMLVIVLGVKWRILPAVGWSPLSEGLGKNLLFMLLPMVSVGLPHAAVLTRTVRSAMLEVLNQDYVRVAYAKGLRGPTVMWRHALKNALIPVLTIAAVQVGYLLGGSVIIEDVFQLPGVGKLAVTALTWRDIPIIQGCLLVYASLFVAINLLVDVLYSLVDPRITYK
jgi:peptide/nickel transport system permease protein